MSIGNLQDYGNKGNNFPWQLKMLKGLQGIIDNLVLLVYPLGQRRCDQSVSTTLCDDQANVIITPGINTVNGLKNMGFFTGGSRQLLTLSIYNQDTTQFIKVSTDAGVSFVPVPPGVTINYDAGGLLNTFDATQIVINQFTATIEPLIIYTYIP